MISKLEKGLLAAASAIILLCVLSLAACGGTVVQERPVSVNIPLPQPCVEGTRPAKVATLKQKYSDEQWPPAGAPKGPNGMDIKQKSAAMGKQAIENREHGEDLDAATSACP